MPAYKKRWDLYCLLSLISLISCNLLKGKTTDANNKTIVFADDNEGIIEFKRDGKHIALLRLCSGNNQSSCTLPNKILVDDFKFRLKQALKLQGNYQNDVKKNIDTYNKVTNIPPALSAEELKDMAFHNKQNLASVLAFALEHGIQPSDVQNFIGLLQSDKIKLDINDLKAISDINARIEQVVDKALDSDKTYVVSSKKDGTSFEYNILKAFVENYQPSFDWVTVGKGEFVMGSPKSEKGRGPDEDEYIVNFTYDFYMMKYTVTQEQWVRKMGYNNSEFRSEKYCKGHYREDGYVSYCANLPVTNVSKEEAENFARSVGARLPTEREWEYAARGGPKAPEVKVAYISETLKKLIEYAVYFDNSIRSSDSGRGQTWPVCSKKPNILGLCDMSGNVYQWTQTYYGAYPTQDLGLAKVTNSQKEPQSGNYFVWRGGSWLNDAPSLRLAFRSGGDDSFAVSSYSYVGFRLVREK